MRRGAGSSELLASVGVLFSIVSLALAGRQERLDAYTFHIWGVWYVTNVTLGESKSAVLADFCGASPTDCEIHSLGRVGHVLVGETAGGYFLFDMRLEPPDVGSVRRAFRVFPDREAWLSAMEAVGIESPPRLEDPAVIAAALPLIESQPWRFQFFHGFLGLQDGTLAGLTSLMTLPISALLGCIVRDRKWRKATVILVAFACCWLLVAVGVALVLAGTAIMAFAGFKLSCLTARIRSRARPGAL